MIWLTSFPPPVVADVAVAAPGFESLVPPGIPIVPLEEARGRAGVVLVAGLSRILTPSNRVKVGQIVLRPRPGLTRIIVDRFLFVVEPWRSYWAFRSVGVAYRDFPDSFRAESRWKDAHAQQTPDPFSLDEIRRHAAGVVVAQPDAPTLPALDVETVAVAGAVHDRYAAEKAAAFAEETSIAAILRRLAAVADEALPGRFMPSPASLFSPRSVPRRVVVTDLPVDGYLLGRLQSVIEITNGMARPC